MSFPCVFNRFPAFRHQYDAGSDLSWSVPRFQPWFLVPKRFQSLHRGSSSASSRGTSCHVENHIWMHRSWSNGAIRAFAGKKQTKRKEDHLTSKKAPLTAVSHVTCLIFFRCTCLCFFNDPRSDLTNLIPWWHDDCNRFYDFSEKTQDPEGRFQNMHPLIITTKSNVWMVHLARVYVIISILSNWESTSPNTAMLREAKKVELLHHNWFLKSNLMYSTAMSN